MMTIFTTPKPFHGHAGIIQRNAIMSWTLLKPRPEIILFGDDEGTADVAAEFGVRHFPDVARNEYNTPLLNDIFDKAQRSAEYDVLSYINADIILMSDFIEAVRRVVRSKRRFLMVGQRWDMEIGQKLDFSGNWEARLVSLVRSEGVLHPATGIDYFVFRRGMWGEMPPFAIGRTVWDNWLCYRARALLAPVIDATEAVMIVHQDHDYAHIPKKSGDAWKGLEAQRNEKLGGGRNHVFTLRDASHKLPKNGPPKLALERDRIARHLETIPILYPRFTPAAKLAQRLMGFSQRVRSGVRRYLVSRRTT